MNFENVYWDWPSMQADNRHPSILAIGDSWFWYPFPGGSLLNQLGPLVAAREHCILALGNNGAEVFDYVYGKYAKSVRTALALHGPGLSAVFISGGGNDFAGFSDLRPMLKDDCSKAERAEDCFRPGDAERTLDWLMKKTAASYRALIGQVLVQSGAKIVMHNYDYAQPSGKGIFSPRSAWLRPALIDAKVPERLHQACINALMDRVSAELEALTGIDKSRIVLVDSRNTLGEKDWANELHPKPAGFRKIARQKWRPVLERIELA